jgi:hypothetical protein
VRLLKHKSKTEFNFGKDVCLCALSAELKQTYFDYRQNALSRGTGKSFAHTLKTNPASCLAGKKANDT